MALTTPDYTRSAEPGVGLTMGRAHLALTYRDPRDTIVRDRGRRRLSAVPREHTEEAMVTVIHGERETETAQARVVGDALWVSSADLERATGWTLTTDGFCRDNACIPMPFGREAAIVDGDAIDIAALWRHMGHPVVRNDARSVWVLGTAASERADALRTLVAPDFTLPDLEGRRHALSDYRGKKVLLVTWASW
jgi:hypothetical protein